LNNCSSASTHFFKRRVAVRVSELPASSEESVEFHSIPSWA